MQPRFAVSGARWSLSFQRRVGTANRGALPCVSLDSTPGRIRIMVPLRVGEALWIAIMTETKIAVDGRAGQRPLRAKLVSEGADGDILLAFDAVLSSEEWVPLDGQSIKCAEHRDEIGRDPLTILLKNPLEGTTQEIGIVPAAPALYETLSGSEAPGPTTERDEYRGWRLP
jgi:hypothetical protein